MANVDELAVDAHLKVTKQAKFGLHFDQLSQQSDENQENITLVIRMWLVMGLPGGSNDFQIFSKEKPRTLVLWWF